MPKDKIRVEGDIILRKMTAIVNFNTGRPNFFDKKEWEGVVSTRQMRECQVRLWNQLNDIDPLRAAIVKPQNPYVK